MTKIEMTKSLLIPHATAARPKMTPTVDCIYENEETGTVVLRVYTSNMTLPWQVNEYISWTYYLVGNGDGYKSAGFHVSSESRISFNGVKEDAEKVVLKRDGVETAHFEIEIEVGDIVIRKRNFELYKAPTKT
jgi:hypothetical protein